jgi:hypothetical protein
MGIQFKTKAEEDILFVSASGFDESLKDLEQYATGVLDTCL